MRRHLGIAFTLAALVLIILAGSASPAQAVQLNPPTNLQVLLDEDSGNITITWSAGSANVLYYEIDRFQYGTTWVGLGETVSTNITDDATKLPLPDSEYRYRVRAIAASPYTDSEFCYGNNIFVGKYLPPTPVLISATPSGIYSIDLTWSDPCTWAHSLKLYCYLHDAESGTPIELDPALNAYTVKGLDMNTAYDFILLSYSVHGASNTSNKMTATTDNASTILNPTFDPNNNIGQHFWAKPSDLTATVFNMANSQKQIQLAWTDGCDGETGFRIMRQDGANGTMQELATGPANSTGYVDDTAQPGIQYSYEVCAIYPNGDSDYSNIASATIEDKPEPQAAKTIMRFLVGSTTYYVNDAPMILDAAPISTENRILLPIRFVVQQLGGTANWDGSAATVNCNGHVIQLWLNQNTASVDGANALIDSGNPAVVPFISSNRIMIPLRFVSENIDCSAEWTGTEAVITYPAVQ